ncbi:MAG: DNA-3-methyladenine glycosylase 2 [Oscillospiraceae bacterium]|jgi:N-glycosylase/DNA lyase|nr:DNA-3-methyladenine glycosylase 2 [Oscillospiraceae bacterium]
MFIELPYIDLDRTLFCGQAFRWEKSGSEYHAVCSRRCVSVNKCDGGIEVNGDNDKAFWENYFAADIDYETLVKRFSSDDTLSKAVEFARGIRVLRQEPLETLITFIISANNNIKRITGIVSRFCENFGDKVGDSHAFPTAEQIAEVGVDGLAVIRAGFRARYIADTAQRIASGKSLSAMGDLSDEELQRELLAFMGVGEKVADCVMLFGYSRYARAPKDVWIKRVLAEYYPSGLPECTRGVEGIAQQFLFEYIRNK